MKNLIKVLLVYLIIIIPLTSLYLSLNIQNEKALKVTQNQLAGLEYLKALYTFNLSLSHYKESISTNSHQHKTQDLQLQLDKNIHAIYKLREKYPQFKNSEFHQRLKQLEDSNFHDDYYYDFLNFINHENYRIGDISTLLFEKDRKVYLLASLITHYMPEYLISLLNVHNQIKEFLVKGSLNPYKKKIYFEQLKLVYLSTDEIHEIVGLLQPYKETKPLLGLSKKIYTILDNIQQETTDISNWKKEESGLSNYLSTTYKLLEFSYQLNDTSFTLLETSLNKRVLILNNKSLQHQLIFMVLILLITVLAFYFHHVNRSSYKKDAEIKEINKTLDKFVVFSKTDREGNITYSSTALENLSGYSKSELLGKNHRIFKSDETQKETFKEMWKTILSKKEWRGEIKNRSKDNSSYWVKIIITPTLDEHGNISGFSSYREDITDKKELEREKEKTQQALEFKSMFLSNMSHEIRTPLNGIIGFTTVALKEDLNKKQKELIYNIKSASDLLLGIINDILDISKIEAGKMTIEYTSFNLKESIETVYALLKDKALEKNIYFKIDYTDIVDFNVLGDSLRFSQVLTNLVSNAIKFTATGGVILRLSSQKNGHILFEVIDTGIGIKESQLKTLFHEFTQADMSTNRKYGGTGLGLAISKKLVEMMGSELNVSCHYGEGCTFSFSLDFQQVKKEVQEKQKEIIDIKELKQRVNALKGKNILVAEDNKMNQTLLNMLLEDSQLNLDMADDGEIALSKFKENSYDIVLMDIQMPNMNGYETSTAIREIDTDVPIIALSANVMAEDIEKAFSSGMNAHLAKPIDLDQLYITLEKYLKT